MGLGPARPQSRMWRQGFTPSSIRFSVPVCPPSPTCQSSNIRRTSSTKPCASIPPCGSSAAKPSRPWSSAATRSSGHNRLHAPVGRSSRRPLVCRARSLPPRTLDRLGSIQRFHRYAYFPFGGGPRVCIGNNFALMEATLILATIARQYRLNLAPDARIAPLAHNHPEARFRSQDGRAGKAASFLKYFSYCLIQHDPRARSVRVLSISISLCACQSI